MKHFLPFDSLSIDRASEVPLQRQLYWQLRRMIEERFLSPGSRLPSSRSLATDLGLSRNTVVTAFDQLATEGYVDARPGARATVVNLPDVPAKRGDEPEKAGRPLISARGLAMQEQPYHHGNPGQQAAFHPGMPDAQNFPFAVWSRLVAKRAMTAQRDLFGSHSVTGYQPLREAIAGYVKVARGVRCTPDQIVVTNGAQSALDLLARVLLDPGDTAWAEEPGYYGAQAAFVSAGAQLQPLHVNREGWELEPPEGDAPRLIYVTPASQQPLGQTMRMEQRLRLLELADRLDAFVIEDDFDGEYRFQGRPIPSLQGSDRSDRVIYLGTFAKLLFPALRIGFMVLPKALVKTFQRPLAITSQYPSPLLQAALADFIDDGYMTTHLKRMRRIYAARRHVFRQLCDSRLSRWMNLLPSDAGISFVGALDGKADDVAVAAAARKRGLVVSPLSMHYRHGEVRPGIVMGYASLAENAMPHRFSQLENAFREALGH